MSDSLILTKAKAFAIRVVKLHKYLRGKREATMSNQILRFFRSFSLRFLNLSFFFRRASRHLDNLPFRIDSPHCTLSPAINALPDSGRLTMV